MNYEVHVEVLFDMTERMRQEIEKPEFDLVGATVGESIDEVGWGSLDPGAGGLLNPEDIKVTTGWYCGASFSRAVFS